jgi:hypothetical protein
MRIPLAFPLVLGLAFAVSAQAAPWEVRRGEGVCEASFMLAARRSAASPFTVRYDGDQLVLAFAAPPGGQFRSLQLDRKAFTPQLRPVGGGFEVIADPAMEKALAKARRVRIVWTKAPTATGQLDGSGPGLHALKDCAEEFRMARLPRIDASEASAIGTYEGEADLKRQSAIADARERYQRERLTSLAAGLLAPEEKSYPVEGMDPIVCTPTLTDFVCR